MAHSHRKSRFSTALDWSVAGLACASAGFLLVAMPDDLFSSLVVRSGLPNVLEAAQPPLGGTARLAAAAAAALFAFAFVLSLLRALERTPSPARAERDEDGAQAAPEVLRLRKADAHPDAPPRRPILAGRELGEPLEAVEPLDTSDDELLLEPEEAHQEFEPRPAAAALPSFLVPRDEPRDEPVEALAEPEFRQEPEPEPEPRPVPQAEAAAPDEPESGVETAPHAGFEAEAEAEAETDYEPEAADLSALMERFESGLTRKQQAIVRPVPQPDPLPPIVEAVPVAEEPADRVGHRLRSAIAELQKVAGQGR
jgi:hypothetical protein